MFAGVNMASEEENSLDIYIFGGGRRVEESEVTPLMGLHTWGDWCIH
jgi:hypothetical protein